jgi:hypothetical protein
MRSFCALLFTALNLVAAPLIVNPSFEESPGLVWPGYTAEYTNVAKGWAMEGGNGGGVNPVLVHFAPLGITASRDLGPNPFADNGIIPHGTNVAYYWTRGRMFQHVSGFEEGKTYVLHFDYNSRSLYARPSLMVRLGGSDIFGPTGPLNPVEGTDLHTRPYYHGISEEFTASGSATFTLELINDAVAGADATFLIDNLFFEELGTNRLLAARRSDTSDTTVMVKFSGPMQPTSANEVTNYVIEPFVQIENAVISPGGTEVVLTTQPMVDDRILYELKTPYVKDATGKRMISANATSPITIPPPPQPTLTIQASDVGLVVSWPARAIGYNLQFVDDLKSPVQWTSILEDIPEFNGQKQYSETAFATNRFYRLIR